FFGGIIMVFEAIAALVAEHNDCDASEVTMESNFKELGIDSLDTVEMLMDLEDKLGQEIELDQKVETVGDLVRFIESKLA
ncbi:MAG: acyl carrier protein, partial [Evtepia sp.]